MRPLQGSLQQRNLLAGMSLAAVLGALQLWGMLAAGPLDCSDWLPAESSEGLCRTSGACDTAAGGQAGGTSKKPQAS